jgi:hypothetical protein
MGPRNWSLTRSRFPPPAGGPRNSHTQKPAENAGVVTLYCLLCSEMKSAPTVNCAELPKLIASPLEGSLILTSLKRKDGPLDLARRHLGEYLEARFLGRNARSVKSRPVSS